MEEPSYNFDFAAGRAALAQGNLELARHHFELLHARFPSSALARYALGDLLLWQNMEFDRAHELSKRSFSPATPGRWQLSAGRKSCNTISISPPSWRAGKSRCKPKCIFV
jgi:hypothetical protein